MNTHEQTYHLIEHYLNGELAGDALIQFENELATNPELASEVAMQQLSREITVQANRHELRVKLKNSMTQFDKQQQQKKYLKYSAAALLITAGVVFYLLNKQSESAFEKTVVEPQKTTAAIIQKKSTDTLSKPIVETLQEYVVTKTTVIPKKENKKTRNQTPPPQNSTVSVSKQVTEKTPKTITAEPAVATTQKIEEPLVSASKKFNCDNVVIKAQPTINLTCIGEANGAIIFSNELITGGTLPYQVTYKKETSKKFKNLYAGYYTFTIIDANKCFSVIDIELEEKECLKANHTLNLVFETEIVLYESNGKTAKLTVFTKNGLPVFEHHYTNAVSWNGTDNGGVKQTTGLYYYIIKTDNETINGQITILN